MQSLSELLKCLNAPESAKEEKIHAYADFVSDLYRHHNDLGTYILTLILEDENIYMIRKAHKLQISPKMHECLENELESLQAIAQMTSGEVKATINYSGFLPDWDNTAYDFRKEYKQRVDNVDKFGYGVYAKYYMFVVKDSNIIPV